jgi:uncharacterized repeat protein (TIGR03803 family)
MPVGRLPAICWALSWPFQAGAPPVGLPLAASPWFRAHQSARRRCQTNLAQNRLPIHYQKAKPLDAGGAGEDNPWLFGVSASFSPLRIAAGLTRFSRVSRPRLMKFRHGGFLMAKLRAWKMARTVFLFCAATTVAAQAQYKVLYTFGTNGPNDGSGSMGKLLRDGQGNLYGTTMLGGSGGSGTVFELSQQAGGAWSEAILYDFCSQSDCSDGAYPEAGLVSDHAGNLYGSTLSGGGILSWGTVFELSPPFAPGAAWTETVLWSFGGTSDGDGCGPRKVVLDAAGNLYGTTTNCGTGPHPSGTVFELSPDVGGGWSETLLYTFNGTDKINPDGSYPVGGVAFDNAGNIYGTTSFGGKLFGGVVYELSPTSSGPWTESVLHAFSPNGVYWPLSSVVFDEDGNLYGTVNKGGVNAAGCTEYGCGGIFKLTNLRGQWLKDSLSFTGLNGGNPAAGIILDEKRKTAYGTTQYGGTQGNGSVFSVHGSKVSVLYNFCSQANCTDGSQALTALTQDGSGNLYGTTSLGGAYNQGVVYEVTP